MKKEIIIIEPTSDNLPWEGCVNSVNYRIERGVPVEVPSEVAAVVRQGELERRRSAMLLDKFTHDKGVKL